MKIQPVKGTRDFYPEVMAVRNLITDLWKQVSLRNGFVEYDGPIFEYLAMYQQKSGDEIAGQLFAFDDRGGRALAIRPEITPTLARMVNQRINTLAKPIKWFSVPRLCRAERPQKGRLREFFQWNIDIIGVEDCLADAEVIFCAADYLLAAGCRPEDFIIRISSRRLVAAMLKLFGIAEQDLDSVYAVLDKKAKLPAEAFEKMLSEAVAQADKRQKIAELMAVESLDDLRQLTGGDESANQAIAELERCFDCLDTMGISDLCKFDITIVRGLAYYTGIVFEIYDRDSELRAICGGGRYDNLLADFGGKKITATGCGMGDCVLGILLEEKGLLATAIEAAQSLDYFVVLAEEKLQNEAIKLVAKLRRSGFKTEFSYKISALGKQLKQASSLGAEKSIIFGSEFLNGRKIVVKNMADGSQQQVGIDDFLKNPV